MKYVLHLTLFLYLLTHNLYGQSGYVDCNTARFICDKNPLSIQSLSEKSGFSDASPGTCFQRDFTESNVIWLKWQVAEAGTLSFTILPIIDSDDIDFVLYRLPDLEKCAAKEVVRCMAAGPNLAGDSENEFSCTGATGLRAESALHDLGNGCPDNGINFLRPVDMQSGESYALFINNFHSSKGLQIEWGGSATFRQIPELCSPGLDISTIATLNNTGTVQLSEPFPNPSAQTVRILAKSSVEQSGQLLVISAEGYLEIAQICTLSPGDSILEIPIEDLRSGVHFIKLKTGGEVYTLRFVKH